MTIKKFDTINVVPFIDIMLVLLVIVLTTASFIAKGEIPLELPDSRASIIQKPDKEANVAITKDNKIFLNDLEIEKDALESQLANFNDKTLFKISCDKEAKFDYFVAVLDLFKAQNLTNLAIVTKQ